MFYLPLGPSGHDRENEGARHQQLYGESSDRIAAAEEKGKGCRLPAEDVQRFGNFGTGTRRGLLSERTKVESRRVLEIRSKIFSAEEDRCGQPG